jgi:hypothetical protein
MGAMGALGVAARAREPSIVGSINISGGIRLGGRRPCDYSRRLLSTIEWLGANTRSPTLWLYSQNDSFFSPQLVGAMQKVYTEAGGKASLRMFDVLPVDGHKLMDYSDRWLPALDEYLREHHLPTWDMKIREHILAQMPGMGEYMDHYLAAPIEKALARSSSLRYVAAAGGNTLQEARRLSLERCEKATGAECHVWIENFHLLEAPRGALPAGRMPTPVPEPAHGPPLS